MLELLNLKNRLPFLIYLIGIVPLGYFSSSVRSMLGDPLALAAAIGYLIALRLVGVTVSRILGWRGNVAIDRHNAAVAAKKQARIQSRINNASET